MLVPTAKKKNTGPPYKIDRLIESGDITNIYCKYLQNRAHSVQEYRTLFFSKRGGCTNVASQPKQKELRLMARFTEKTHDHKIGHFLINIFQNKSITYLNFVKPLEPNKATLKYIIHFSIEGNKFRRSFSVYVHVLLRQ